MSLGGLPGLGAPAQGTRLPRLIGTSSDGTARGAGTGTFTHTNGMTQLAGAKDILIAVHFYHSAVDAFAATPTITVNGVSGTFIQVENDNVSDNANLGCSLFLVRGVVGTGNIVYAQSGQNANNGYVWSALHFDHIDTIEDSSMTLGLVVNSHTVTGIDCVRPSMVIGCTTHSLAVIQTQTNPSNMSTVLDFGRTALPTVRTVWSLGYEMTPVTNKSYTFGINGGTDGRQGGIVATFSNNTGS